MVPPELCWAAGYVPFNWETFASFMASHTGISELANLGSEETPRCSFVNAIKGAYIKGLLPQPNVGVSSSAYCAGIGYMFEELTVGFDVRHLHIDLPEYSRALAVDYVASQLAEIYNYFCKNAGISRQEGEDRLRETMAASNKARKAYIDLFRIRRENPDLDLSLEPLLWHFQFFAWWGTERGVAICEALRDEVKMLAESGSTCAPGDRRLGVFSLYPYGRTQLWNELRSSGVQSVFEGLNWLGELDVPDLDSNSEQPVEDLFLELAVGLMRSPMRGGQIQQQVEEAILAMQSFGAEGILLFSHDQCQMLNPRLQIIEQVSAKNNLPVCVLNGDCLLGVPMGPAGLRLRSFLSTLGETEQKLTTSSLPAQRAQNTDLGYRLGVDFGSGYSKYVLLDSGSNIVDSGSFCSGIDYPALLGRIVNKTPDNEDCAVAVAGIGADNPRLQEIAQHLTSEITALRVAVRHLTDMSEPLLAVDIGTQDIKIIKYYGDDRAPWCNTNKACGAGTGCVLAQILDRWRQSEPDMTFDRLDEMAFQATRSETINTTCGIFAVTNVVSALTQADDERRAEILRGLYDYIATQAIRHLPPEDRNGGRMLLVGGLARHRTLRALLQEEGFDLVPLPDGLHPQFVVSYGAAMALSD
ncbi:MAG: hypothetical protein GY906_13625 [bacterium]|nr:hypothetical protein [bacterium]